MQWGKGSRWAKSLLGGLLGPGVAWRYEGHSLHMWWSSTNMWCNVVSSAPQACCTKCGCCHGGWQMHQRMCPKAMPRAGNYVTGSTSRVWLVLGLKGKWQEFNIVYSYAVCFMGFCNGIPTAPFSYSYLLLLSDVSHIGSKIVRIILFLANITVQIQASNH